MMELAILMVAVAVMQVAELAILMVAVAVKQVAELAILMVAVAGDAGGGDGHLGHRPGQLLRQASQVPLNS